MLKQYKLICALALCGSYNIMYGRPGGATCFQLFIRELKMFFLQSIEEQSASKNRWTKKVVYYPGSKKVKIHLNTDKVVKYQDASEPFFDFSRLKGAPNNFYEVVPWDDRENHPLYPFLMQNGVLDRKNSPHLLPKTIM